MPLTFNEVNLQYNTIQTLMTLPKEGFSGTKLQYYLQFTRASAYFGENKIIFGLQKKTCIC